MQTLENKKPKKFKCSECNNKYTSLDLLVRHFSKEHRQILPDGVTIKQYLFNYRNKKDFQICVMCKKNHTKWNEQTGHYERYCDDVKTKCREKAGILAKENMNKIYHKDHLLNDPAQQRKMLENRSISGVYTFKDGTKLNYVGTYELDFLRFYENDLHMSSKDIGKCDKVFTYKFDGEKHFYIPDFFIDSLNLIIEIKDGGNNPNNHPNIQMCREKDDKKLQAVKECNSYNFIKIEDKDYSQFISLIKSLEDQDINVDDVFIVVPEK